MDDQGVAGNVRRDRILSATVSVIRERGFARSRVSDIASLAGTSTGLVLYHFGSLGGAMQAALVRLEDEFYDDLAEAMRDLPGPVDRLRYMAELGAGSGPAVGDWRLWLELWVRALHDPQARHTRESLDRRWRLALDEVIAEGIAEGVFSPRDPAATAVRLACLMDGLAIQLALGEVSMSQVRMVDLWWQGAMQELRSPGDAELAAT